MLKNNIHKVDKQKQKEDEIIKAICKECGKQRAIPSAFCADCIHEMRLTLNKD